MRKIQFPLVGPPSMISYSDKHDLLVEQPEVVKLFESGLPTDDQLKETAKAVAVRVGKKYEEGNYYVVLCELREAQTAE